MYVIPISTSALVLPSFSEVTYGFSSGELFHLRVDSVDTHANVTTQTHVCTGAVNVSYNEYFEQALTYPFDFPLQCNMTLLANYSHLRATAVLSESDSLARRLFDFRILANFSTQEVERTSVRTMWNTNVKKDYTLVRVLRNADTYSEISESPEGHTSRRSSNVKNTPQAAASATQTTPSNFKLRRDAAYESNVYRRRTLPYKAMTSFKNIGRGGLVQRVKPRARYLPVCGRLICRCYVYPCGV
jgi:hypothetical protein